MADNINVTPGSGAVVAADDIGNVLYQRIKPVIGADGVGVDWTGEQHIGEVGGKTILVPITFTLDTAQYSSGDVLADTQILSSCLRIDNGTGIIQDVVFLDKDDQGQAFDVYILNANNSLGTENSAPNITDTNAESIIGLFSVLGSDLTDLNNSRIANIKNIGISVKGATGTDDLYVALISRGTGTYTANGITAIFKILCD